jgi:hypothetical protein
MGLLCINVQASRTERGRHLGIGKHGADKKLGASPWFIRHSPDTRRFWAMIAPLTGSGNGKSPSPQGKVIDAGG